MNPVFRFFYDKEEFSLLRTMVIVSIVTHVIAVIVMSRYGLAKPGKRIVTIKMVQAQKEAGVKKSAQSEGKKVEAAPTPRASAEPAAAPAAPSPAAQAARTEAIRKSVSKKGLLNVLGKTDFSSSSKTATNFGSAFSRAGSGSGGSAGAGAGTASGPAGFGYSMGGGSPTGDNWTGKSVETKSFSEQSAADVAKAAPKVTKLEKSAETKVVSNETAKTAEELTNKEVLEVIKRTVEGYMGGLRYSYNKQLRKNPDLQGRVTVAITVSPAGAVEDAKVTETTMNSPEMEQEIISKIKHWSFPAILKKTTTVTYPFVFLPPT